MEMAKRRKVGFTWLTTSILLETLLREACCTRISRTQAAPTLATGLLWGSSKLHVVSWNACRCKGHWCERLSVFLRSRPCVALCEHEC